jgi:hypothetical protein
VWTAPDEEPDNQGKDENDFPDDVLSSQCYVETKDATLKGRQPEQH